MILRVLMLVLISLFALGCAVTASAGVRDSGKATFVAQAVGIEDAVEATAPVGTVEATIQAVVLRGNRQQEQAIARRDSEPMRDTSTAAHFAALIDLNESLLEAGVSSIRLVNIEWGDIVVTGRTATVTAWETWTTTFQQGRVTQARDRNVYTLILEDGLWKILYNDHPSAGPAVDGPAVLPGSSVETSVPGPNPDLPSAVTRGRSSNWSGYAALWGTYTGVSGTWIVPEPTADGNMGVSATWVGIGGERTRDLIQAGTLETVQPSGRIRYSAWYEILPAPARPVRLTVRPGDSVTVSVNQQEPGIWSIAFVNNTTGQTLDRTVPYASSLSSAEWIVEAPSLTTGGLLPLSNFGTVYFTDGAAVKDGQTMTIAEARALPITMTNRCNEALATPSVIDDSGVAFNVKREAASPTVTGAGCRRDAQ